MTRPREDVLRVKACLDDGLSATEAARRLGIPRGTIVDWVRTGIDRVDRRGAGAHCDPCPWMVNLDEEPYSYLLGLYLGDGCISACHRDVFRLRIALDQRYPSIISECQETMEKILPNRSGKINGNGCIEVYSYSRHWPCLFPQHGPGRKHLRPILLEPWQAWVAVERHPRQLIRGLIHSDGCRFINRVKGYEYPRYSFSNRSKDIRDIFCRACDRAGIQWKQSNTWVISISRRADVALMDSFVGPKC